VEHGIEVKLLELVGEGEIPVQAGLQPFDIVDKQVRLERVPGPGRRDGAEGVWPCDFFDALRAPEQERKLIEA
jgi:hypothetical protein